MITCEHPTTLINCRIVHGEYIAMHVPEFTIIRDDREGLPLRFEGLYELHVEPQEPFRFRGLTARNRSEEKPILAKTTTRRLETGDYTIDGLESLVAVERKSLSDLYGTLASGRDRFQAEHERMAKIVERGGRAVVVIEATYEQATQPQDWCNLHPHSVIGYAASWPYRYGVPWHFAGTRHAAEDFTYRFLEMFWREQQAKNKANHQSATTTPNQARNKQ